MSISRLRRAANLACVGILLILSASALWSQQPPPSTLEQAAGSVSSLRNQAAGGCGLGMLFGAFCALWAQNTRRNAFLWFLLGAIFSVITVMVLLYKNSQDIAQRPLPVPTPCPKCGRSRTAEQLVCDCGHYFGADH